MTGIALTQDKQHLLSCSDDKSLKVWCTTTLSCLRTVQLHDYPASLAVSQQGDVVTKSLSFATLYRLSSGECLGKVGSNGVALALSPCGRWLFTPMSNSSVSVRAVSSVSP